MHHSRDLRRERWGVKHEPRDGGFGLATALTACPTLLWRVAAACWHWLEVLDVARGCTLCKAANRALPHAVWELRVGESLKPARYASTIKRFCNVKHIVAEGAVAVNPLLSAVATHGSRCRHLRLLDLTFHQVRPMHDVPFADSATCVPPP